MGSILLAAEEALRRVSPKPLIILLLGAPGAGKGTLAPLLSEALGLPHVSTGDLFRSHIREKTPLGLVARSYIDQGNLVPDELVFDMLFGRLEGSDCTPGCLLDGFPRTLHQAEALDARLRAKCSLLALNLSVPDPVLIERIAGRLVCNHCKRPFHKLFDPPKESGICSGCGSALYTRDDDQEAVVRHRLEVYQAQTAPLIEYYAAQKGALKVIDGRNSKEQVFHDALNAVPAFLRGY